MQSMHVSLDLNPGWCLQRVEESVCALGASSTLTRLELTAVPPSGYLHYHDYWDGDFSEHDRPDYLLLTKFFDLASLKSMPSTSVSFSQSFMYGRHWMGMHTWLSKLTHLTSLSLRCCMDVPVDLALANILRDLPHLQQLDVGLLYFGDKPRSYRSTRKWNPLPCEQLFAGMQHLTRLALKSTMMVCSLQRSSLDCLVTLQPFAVVMSLTLVSIQSTFPLSLRR